VALLSRTYDKVGRAFLEGLGYNVILSDMPFPVEKMVEPLRHFAENDRAYDSKRLISEEHAHLNLFTLGGYDKVVFLDMDVLVMDAIDELIDDSHELLGIYDYYGWMPDQSVMPPINGGFFVAKPSNETFNELVQMIKQGDFSAAGLNGYPSGWDKTGVGYYYGGISLQGLLTVLYHKDLIYKSNDWKTAFSKFKHDPSLKFKEIDQCVYNVLGHPNCLGSDFGVQGTKEMWIAGNCRNVDCNPNVNPTAESVIEHAKVAHFSGSCSDFRPWKLCTQEVSSQGLEDLQKKNRNPVCTHFLKRWAQIGEQSLRDPAVRKWAPTLEKCVSNLKQVQ
jgi:hypothetical protein